MEQKLLSELNALIEAEFGRNHHGDANYKWAMTSELFGFECKGHLVPRQILTPGGPLWAVESRYERYTVADIVGNRWAFAKWAHMRRGEWIAVFGTTWPWPSRGEYHMVGSPMPEGEEPCHKSTEALIYHLHAHLAMTLEDHEQDLLVQLEEKKRNERGPVEDAIDDSIFAFEHLPGAKDNVSLPTAQFRENFQEQPT
jgi:hypothetical protein